MADLLIVEDDVTLLMGLTELLTMNGHDVRGANSGQAALDAIQNQPPELIISDVRMPGMSGTELLDAVRDQPDWAGIPFLFVSASTTPAVRGHLAATPGVSFLLKPFDIDQLIEAVAASLSNDPPPLNRQDDK
jgi:CheY-like chemotaxis protein